MATAVRKTTARKSTAKKSTAGRTAAKKAAARRRVPRADEGVDRVIDALAGAEQTALEAVRRFLETVNGAVPDSDGARSKIIESAFRMTEELVGTSNEFAHRLVKAGGTGTRRATARKAPARKAAARKASTRKAPAKKAPARKAVAR